MCTYMYIKSINNVQIEKILLNILSCYITLHLQVPVPTYMYIHVGTVNMHKLVEIMHMQVHASYLPVACGVDFDLTTKNMIMAAVAPPMMARPSSTPITAPATTPPLTACRQCAYMYIHVYIIVVKYKYTK